MIVSNMKMYAWIRPMKRSKGFQMISKGPSALIGQRRHDDDHQAAREEVAEETEVKVIGLVISSMRLIGVRAA
jgi:hypothetical protein